MKKAKFKIHGMHCNSCALLIEKKLKSHPGIIKAKTSYDSQKAIVIYDGQKIQESELLQIIEGAGNYQVEKIEDTEERESSSRLNLSVPISIIIAGLIIGGAIIINGNTAPKNVPSEQVAQIQDSPSRQPSTVQTFEITKDNHIRGDFNAPITLVEFSCFECPFSARHNPTLIKIIDDYKGRVRLVYKHFPLGFHPNAQKAAEASECADEQEKFWEYHDKLFENQPEGYSLDKFKQWAKDLGLNSGKFNNCLDSGKFAQKVKDDFQEGTEKGVNGTPATFVNGQLENGALPYETFKLIIDGLLNQ